MDKFSLKIEGFEYIINIDTKDLSRFVDDTLAGFDAILHRVIAKSKYGVEYIDCTEEQLVEIDNTIESLK